MMTAVREWLTGVMAVTLLLSVVQMLLPKGSLRQIGSFIAGLLLLAALLRPLLDAAPVRLELDLDAYRQEIGQRQEELSREGAQSMASIIQERTQAYISEEAVRLGVSVKAEVQTALGEDGVPLPWSVRLTGARSRALSEWIASELGIPAERQVWYEGMDES